MTSKERVKRAIQFDNPDRVPLLFFNRDFKKSDIIIADVSKPLAGENKDRSEWGYVWEKLDETMGQPKSEVIKDWDELKNYRSPDPKDKTRFDNAKRKMKQYGKDKYYLASLELSGFTIMSFLRGFENLLVDFYCEPILVDELADIVFGFEEEIIKQLRDYGFDGVAFFDDLGTQTNLILSPELWRTKFKDRYERQFRLAHDHGLEVYFHSCGFIEPIIPDFIDMGVDMLNISQPNLYDIKQLGNQYGGKVCFVCPVSYQTTSISGTREEILSAVKELRESLGNDNGGLIGYIEEYSSMGMSLGNYESCIDAFNTFGRY